MRPLLALLCLLGLATAVGLAVARVSLAETCLAPFPAELTHWLDMREADAVLVRPDRCVFGTGAPAALARAFADQLRNAQPAAV